MADLTTPCRWEHHLGGGSVSGVKMLAESVLYYQHLQKYALGKLKIKFRLEGTGKEWVDMGKYFLQP